MFDAADATFASLLERSLVKILSGDGKTNGLYQNLLGAQTWDDFQRMKGEITAYESVRREMHRLADEMNRDYEARIERRSIVN